MNIPDQKYVDTVVALAQQGVLFIFDLGYFKLKLLPALWKLVPTFKSPQSSNNHL